MAPPIVVCFQVCPRGIADRVNLGLIPSSEAGWETACAALRNDRGGWLHIHGNVSWRSENKLCGPARTLCEAGEMREKSEVCETGEFGEMREKGEVCEAGEIREKGEVCEAGEMRVKGEVGEVREKSEVCEAGEMRVKGEVGEVREKSEVCEAGEMREKGEVCEGDALLLPGPRERAKRVWAEYVRERVGKMLSEVNALCDGRRWSVRVGRLVTVKSYAPFVDHMVVDMECRPDSDTE